MAALKVLGIIVACLCALAFVFGSLAESYLELAPFAKHSLQIRVFSACGVVVGFLMFAIGAYYVSTAKRTTAKTAGVWCSCALVAAVTAAVAWTTLDQKKARDFGPSKAALTRTQVDKIAKEYFPYWAIANPDKVCPSSLLSVGKAVSLSFTEEDFSDAWGRPLKWKCELVGDTVDLIVHSMGDDGADNTADDIRSRSR